MASAEGGRGAASAPQAQGQRGGPAWGAEKGRPWDRDWVPDPLGEETLPLVGEVYGWLCWANQGTSRRSRNRPFDAVLLRRDGGNREVPPGGWAAPEDHERVLRSVIRAAWPDRGPTWPAFLERGSGAPHHGCGRQQLAPPGFAQRPRPPALPPAQPAAAAAPAPTQPAAQVRAQTAGTGELGGGLCPPAHAPPKVRHDARGRATSRGGECGDNERGGEPAAPQPANH